MNDKNTLKLFFSKNTSQYYYTGNNICCHKCGSIISYVMIHATSWWKNKSVSRYYCTSCWDKIKRLGVVDEFKLVNLVSEVPLGSIPVFVTRPELVQCRDLSVFDAACGGDDGTTVIDMTRHAGRESVKGAVVGCPDMGTITAKDESFKNLEGGVRYLELLHNAERKPKAR